MCIGWSETGLRSRWKFSIPLHVLQASKCLNHGLESLAVCTRSQHLLESNWCWCYRVRVRLWDHTRRFLLMHIHWSHSSCLVNKLKSICSDWTNKLIVTDPLFMCVVCVGVHHWTSEGSQKGWGHLQRPNAGVLDMLPLSQSLCDPGSNCFIFWTQKGGYTKGVVVPWVLWISWSSLTWIIETK